MSVSYFTSESVTEGHPDKVCDQVADRILDALLVQDPYARVACEVTAQTDRLHIFGEITADADVNYEHIARQTIADIGYTKPDMGFDADSCVISVELHEQSPDISMGIGENGLENAGAGDQGMMFGFACRETESLMPLPIELAHALTKRLAKVRKSGALPYLLPDGKSQVTVEYNDGVPVRIAAVVLSAQHKEEVSTSQLRQELLEQVILPALPSRLIENTGFYINPTGRFVMGGPAADTGLTGRKIIVDTYGGYARHGGGSFSGKDPTKVDRSAAYMARYVAKNIVAAGLAGKCEVQLSYAIGVAKPVSVRIDTMDTGLISAAKLEEMTLSSFDFRPASIIRQLSLRGPCYGKCTNYGHFGSNRIDMPWENVDWAEKKIKEGLINGNI